MTLKDTKGLSFNIPLPSIPPSQLFPVTVTFSKPDSRNKRWHNRSNPFGDICFKISISWEE